MCLAGLRGQPKPAELVEIYRAHYRGAVRVAVRAAAAALAPQALNDTDEMEIFVLGDPTDARAVLIARLDNLGKGASGAAVQNIALMLGLALPTARAA